MNKYTNLSMNKGRGNSPLSNSHNPLAINPEANYPLQLLTFIGDIKSLHVKKFLYISLKVQSKPCFSLRGKKVEHKATDYNYVVRCINVHVQHLIFQHWLEICVIFSIKGRLSLSPYVRLSCLQCFALFIKP